MKSILTIYAQYVVMIVKSLLIICIGVGQIQLFLMDFLLLRAMIVVFLFLENEISCSQLNEFYEREYRKVGSPFYWDYGSTFEIPRSLPTRSKAQIYLATIFTEFLPGDIFLDIGPGPGDSLFSAGHLLNKPKLIAIEPNQVSASYYDRNFGAKSIASLSDMSASGLKAKIILLSHSLEHFRHSDLSILFKSINEVLDVRGGCWLLRFLTLIFEFISIYDFLIHHIQFSFRKIAYVVCLSNQGMTLSIYKFLAILTHIAICLLFLIVQQWKLKITYHIGMH